MVIDQNGLTKTGTDQLILNPCSGSLALLSKIWPLPLWEGRSISVDALDTEAKVRRSKEVKLNNLKYDLMMLTQDLGRMVPFSRLAEELLAKKSSLQEEITKLEQELSAKAAHKPETRPEGIKKVKDEDGQVRIWSSSSAP
jgi:hypothetical protein